MAKKKQILWHTLSRTTQERLRKSPITVAEFLKDYRQPRWCGFHEALAGPMGCWSLMTPGLVRTAKDCRDCDDCEVTT